jgi:DNA-binding transcriptional LysR family regulator
MISSSSEPNAKSIGRSCAYSSRSHASSFNKAVAQLGLSHPTIDRSVRRLEQALGTPLIAEAFARGIKLTPPGKRLSRKLASIDRQLVALLQQPA